LINISMGSHGDSAIVRNAIRQAIDSGALIIASVGNNGIDQVSYPAANDGVIGVGAVDATGNHLLFSNTGQQVDIAAPGFGLNAAWTQEELARVSGTSFSAPIVTGALAAIMTEYRNEGLTAAQAWEILNAYLNDGGAPGEDPELGAGMPDIGRVLDSLTPGIRDAAVASQRVLPATPGTPFGEIEILIQNRGTEPLINTAVHVSMGGGTTTSNITILAPNAVRTVRVPIPGPPALSDGKVRVHSSVALSSGQDVKPVNDQRIETLVVDPSR
jgi:subtilisin family serine protease